MTNPVAGSRRELRYPSDEFSPPPEVGILVPAGWESLVLPRTLIAARLASDGDDFAPNVVVTSDRVVDGIAEVFRRQSASIDELTDVSRSDPIDSEINGQQWRCWEYAFSDPEAGTLMQIVAVTDAESHMVSVVVTASADAAERTIATLRAIVQSVTLR
ncbi:MAG: hypothetical protein ABI435_00415 [Pseudolysinimonas sp.]